MTWIDQWMDALTGKLKAAFADRLLFVGLQGSYRRGEANEGSDIDAVVILDDLAITDLARYKGILSAMPEHEKACGFISGKREIANWPTHELFQFARDTRSFFGTLEGLLPPVTRKDVVAGVKNGASGLYHACCHSYLHGDPEELKDIYKGVFFILLGLYYLRHGRYISHKAELIPLLAGVEREILETSFRWEAHQDNVRADPGGYYALMLGWCADVLCRAL